MRISRIAVAGALATAALLAPQVTASAASDASTTASTAEAVVTTTGDITVIASGQTATGGWVEFTGTGRVKVDGSHVKLAGGKNTMQAAGSQNVGGGTWYYGSSVNGIGQKTCTSQYLHPSSWHGSSVWMDQWASDRQAPGKVANSNFTRYTTTTCSAYWSVG